MAKNTLVQPNFVDKIVTFLAPERGMRRQAARAHLALSGGYVGAKFDNRNWADRRPGRGSADADTRPDLIDLSSRCRDADRNAPLAGGAKDNLVRNTVGTGLSAHPSPDFQALGWTEEQAAAWAEDVFREFDLYACSSDCDITRTQNFYQNEELVMSAVFDSGDVVVLLPRVPVPGSVYATRIQVIEADRLISPNGDGRTVRYFATAKDETENKSTESRPIWGGVECDEYGAPVAYYILDEHPGSLNYVANRYAWKRYAAFGSKTGRRLVLHPFRRKRPDQKRGVPLLAPVIDLLKQLSQYTDAEIKRAVISSMFTVFVRTPQADGLPGLTKPKSSSSDDEHKVGLAPGAIIDLGDGEDVSFADPKSPNTAFDPFVQSLLRQIGMRLGMPYEVLIQHFTASYSAARAALLEFWKLVKDNRNFLATTFCGPVYEAWMDEAVAIGRVSAPGYFSDPAIRRAYQRVEWVGDAPGQIDPVKETEAAKAKIDAGLSDLRAEAMKLEGRSWLEIHRNRKREHAMRVKDGLEPAIANATATESVNPPKNEPKPNDQGSDLETPEAA